MAAQTLTTNMTPAQITKYSKNFLEYFKEIIVAEQFGQVVDIEEGGGKTIDFFRYHPLAKVTAAGSEGAKGFTYKGLLSMNITATLTEWYDQVDFSMLHYRTSRDRTLTAGIETVATQAAESNDLHIMKTLCEKNIWPLPASAFNSLGVVDPLVYAEDVTLDDVTSTTVFQLDDTAAGGLGRSKLADALEGGWLCVSRGAGYGHSCRITGYATVTHEITVIDALPETPVSSDGTNPTYMTIASPFNVSSVLGSGDVLSTALLNKAVEILRKNRARKFANGRYACLITPEVHRQLLHDKLWRETAVRSPALTDGGYRNGLVAEWADIDFFIHTTSPRYATALETVNSFSETTGNAYMTLVLGKDSFGVVGLGGESKPTLSIKIPNPSDGNTSNPNNTFGTVGWYRAWVVKPLNANFCVGILSIV